ncbi:MAG: hypothetical protein M3537_07160 [Chloroflexota bacterium]|nr:hypothetical protein [Chloroflexota bacterium]
MSVENPTPSELRTNHERATKAAAALTEKDRSGMTRYTAILPEGKPARIRVESRPYDSRSDEDFTHDYTVDTQITDRQGVPINYSNEYTGNHSGTMTRRVHERRKTLSAKYDGLRSFERKLEDAKEALAAAEQAIVSRKADIARLRGE